MSRERRYQAAYATDDTLSPGRAVEHVTVQFDALFRAHYRRIAASSTASSVNPTLPRNSPPRRSGSCISGRPANLTNAEAWLCRTGCQARARRVAQGPATRAYESAAPLAARAHNPEDDFARAQEQERVRQVLAAMKPYHAALLMLRAEGLSYQELAAALRLNPASVGTMFARAESKFRQEYEKRHGDEMDAPDTARDTRIAGSKIVCARSIRRTGGSP